MNRTISLAKDKQVYRQEIDSEQNSKVHEHIVFVSRKYQRKVKACKRREEKTRKKLLECIERKDKDKRSKWMVSRKTLRETPTIVT